MSSIEVSKNGTERKGTASAASNNQERILSLSGGGVKGIAELVVLAEIEERTGKSISELFPIITGTSVGGLVAALLTIPKEQGSKEPKYSSREALEIFKAAAPKIFKKRWYSGMKQVFKHKYNNKALQEVLEKELGNNRLSNSTSRLIVPVTDLESEGREVKLFDSRDSYSSHIKTKDVLLATTAAPTYFKAVSNREDTRHYTSSNKKEISYNYVDGGLAANRPMYEVLKRLKQERKDSKAASQNQQSLSSSNVASAINSSIFGVSLNFNNEIGSYAASTSSKFDGVIGWLSKGKLVDRLLKSSEDAAAEGVRSILKSKDQHIELTIPITEATNSLDDASPANIAALEELGRKLIKEKDKELSELCRQLVENVSRKENDRSKNEVGGLPNQTLEKDEGYESDSELASKQPTIDTDKHMKKTKIKSVKEQEKEYRQGKELNHATLARDSMFIVGGERDLNVPQLSFADANIELDAITESLRKEILEKQREQLRLYFSSLAATHPELAEHTLDDTKFQKFLRQLNNEHRALLNNALANEKVKAEMEQIEIEGYRNIHARFKASPSNPNGFTPMDWSDFTERNGKEVNSRSQIVRNAAGGKIATLKEQTHKTTPLTISKQDGTGIIVSSYRTIDLPVQLEDPASGTMHLSLVARDKDGKAPPLTKAVYFTAHYEATPKPNGVPKLKEVSSPIPIKFLGSSKDAIGYIEHGGEIYTLPVTKGKYEEMMREVAKNQGQAIDVSQEVEQRAQDLASHIGKVSAAEIESVTTSQLASLNNLDGSKAAQIKYHEEQIAKYKNMLKELEPALNARDKEREKILLLTKKCLTDAQYKELKPYIRKTAKQHIEAHHEAYLEEADGGKALSELYEIVQNIGFKGFGVEGGAETGSNAESSLTTNSRNALEKSRTQQLKGILKAGTKLGFNVVLESIKSGGIDVYLRQQAIESGKQVASYAAKSIADKLRDRLCGKVSCNTASETGFSSYVSVQQSNSKSSGVSR